MFLLCPHDVRSSVPYAEALQVAAHLEQPEKRHEWVWQIQY